MSGKTNVCCQMQMRLDFPVQSGIVLPAKLCRFVIQINLLSCVNKSSRLIKPAQLSQDECNLSVSFLHESSWGTHDLKWTFHPTTPTSRFSLQDFRTCYLIFNIFCRPQSPFFTIIKVSPQFLIKGISSFKPLIQIIYKV